MATPPVYMDDHATTRTDPRVVEAMLPYFDEHYGNAASVNHVFGTQAAEAVERARETVAALAGVPPRCVVFTSGATEANNLALKGVLRAAGGGRHLVTTAAEHRAVLDPADRLRREGHDVTVLPVDEHAVVDPECVADELRAETALVSVIAANNEVGSLNDLTAIARICRERGVPLHTDAVQAFGKLSLADVGAARADLVSVSAHKLYGPKGVGALFVRRDPDRRLRIEPLFDGGGHERRLRSGTLPVPLIVGFGKACELAGAEMADERLRVARLRDRLWTGLRESLEGIHLNGHPDRRLSGNLNVSFEGVDGDALMTRLPGLAVSSGSACTSADPQPSHVLRAIGRGDALTRASLRFGLGRFSSEADVQFALKTVIDAVRRLRALRDSSNRAGA